LSFGAGNCDCRKHASRPQSAPKVNSGHPPRLGPPETVGKQSEYCNLQSGPSFGPTAGKHLRFSALPHPAGGWQPASCAGCRGTLWVARSLPSCPTSYLKRIVMRFSRPP
jgi:hypothetical protein